MYKSEPKEFLCVGEVALRLRQSEATVRRKIREGSIPALKIGTGPRAAIRVDSDELERWLYGIPLPLGSRAPVGEAVSQPRPSRPPGEAA
jgi:excisionase family DNA binding protein